MCEFDKTYKKDYNKGGIVQKNQNVFEDDETANTAINYLYSNDNLDKTQDFLKNNGFPSAEERQYNKDNYGEQEENEQMLDLFKNKSDSVFNPKLPDDTDRAFLKGLMGEEEEERDYQKQVSSADSSQSEWERVFHGSQVENNLKPSVQTIESLPENEHTDNLNTKNYSVFDLQNAYDIARYSNNYVPAPHIKSGEYNNRIRENAKMNDKSVDKIRKSSDIIARNAESIKKAASKYGVNPAIIAACIYTEQVLNYNFLDSVFDKISWIDPSVGIGQVLISTAKKIEEETDIEKIEYLGKTIITGRSIWNVPGYGKFIGTKEDAISKRLNNEEQCVEYVAAYLKMIQDLWWDAYPIIDGKTDILATLYNMGEYGGEKGINSNPEPREFGIFAKNNYYHMQYLLGIKQEV